VEIRRDQTGNMSGTTTVKYVAALCLLYAALLFVLNLQPTSYLGCFADCRLVRAISSSSEISSVLKLA